MIRTTTLFYLMLFPIVNTAIAGNGGNIGQIDDRKYGSLKDSTYSSVARLITGRGGTCTAGFIDKNLIVSNHHCADLCSNPGTCSVTFWNGEEYINTPITIVSMRESYTTIDGNDWAIFRTEATNQRFSKIAQQTTPGKVQRGGFGGLRIIKDEEIPRLKALYIATRERYRTECETKQKKGEIDFTQCVNQYYYKAIEKEGIQPLNGDVQRFKIQECNIIGNHPQQGAKNMFKSDCDSAGGDSGAPLLRNGTIVGLNNSGYQGIFLENETDGAGGVKTESFYATAQATIKGNKPSTNPAPTQPAQQPTSPAQQNPILTEPNKIQQVQINQLQAFQCN